jgi:undecaprenyl-diphosphatase
MKKQNKILYTAIIFLIAFILWTFCLNFVDLKPIGPDNSTVGFATINKYFHNLTGVNTTLYTITDWLGLVPIFVAFFFGVIGLIEWIKRKSVLKVDFGILTLGGFYVVVMLVYILFEKVVINYRPVLINGVLEVSYPSSTTLLTMCVMPTAIIEFKELIKSKFLNKFLTYAIIIFTAFMVIGRLLSGVHWLTDIIGGALLSTFLVTLYYYLQLFHTFNKTNHSKR